MPEHAAGDWLFAFLNRDTAATPGFTAPSGWLLIRQQNSAGSSNAMYAKYAASSSETAAFTHTSETGNGVVVAVRDGDPQVASGTITLGVNSGTGVWTRSSGDFSADGFVVGMTVFISGMTTAANNGARTLTAVGTTTFTTATTGLVTESGSGDETVVSMGIGANAASGSDDSTNPLTGVGVTTLFANSLLLHFLGGDTVLAPLALPPWINLYGGDAGAGGINVSYSVEPAVTAVTAPDHWAGAVDDTRGLIIEVMPGPNDTQAPYIPLDTVPATQITALTATGSIDGGTHIAAASIAITTVAGKTVTGITASAVTDSGTNVFRSVLGVAGSSSTTNLSHSEFDFTSTVNVTTGLGIVFGTWFHAGPRDYFDSGTPAQGGKYVLLGSSTTAWRAWVVGGYKAIDDLPDARNNYAIQVGNTDTQYDSAGSANYSALDYMAWGSSGFRGAPAIRWGSMFLLNVCVLAGGTADNPFDFDDLVYVVNNGCGVIPLMQQVGQAVLVWTALQFGGNETIGISCNLNTFQMPRRADESKYVAFHVAPNVLGYEFYGLDSDDLISFTNCVFTSPSSYYWRFHASHDADAVIDFAGTSVVNATVTLRSTVVLDGMSFIDCSTFTLNSAELAECSFSNTKVSAAQPGDLADVTDSTFESAGTGHAIEISGTAANVTLDGLVFIGYATSNGSTGNEAIYVNIGSGSMTISIVGGGSVPSIRTAGATVTVVNTKSYTLTNLVAGTEVRIFRVSDGVELAGVESSGASFSYDYNYVSDTDVRVIIQKAGYLWRQISATLGNVDQTQRVSQDVDYNYANP
jgi:hypothetical protein